VGLGLGGCLGPEYADKVTPLAEIPGLELVLESHSDTALILLTFDAEQLEGCPIGAPSLHATFNGAPLSLAERGGSDVLDRVGLSCFEPAFLGQMPAQSPGRFVVADDSLTISGEVGDALLPRAMALVPDGPWTFARGQTVTVRWTPASDLAAAVPKVKLGGQILATTPASGPDLITFTLPDAVLGAAQLFINFNRGRESVPCTAARCRLGSQEGGGVFQNIFIQ
jgi:hypothetical protein